MNSVPFHDTLNCWAHATSLNGLARMVLECHPGAPVKYKDVAPQVNERIKQFAVQNEDRFFSMDLPVLKKIHALLPKKKYTHSLQKKHVAQLKETIKTMIKLTNNKPDLSHLPPELVSLCDGYATLTESTNLCMAKITPSSKRSISFDNVDMLVQNEDKLDIYTFVEEIRQRSKSHPDIFKKMISEFFQHASSRAQILFFELLNDKEFSLLNDIISAFPKNLTYLNIVNCKCLKQCHLENIAQRLKNLHSLSLSRHQRFFDPFEDYEIKALIKLPNLLNLSLNYIPLSENDAKAIAKMTQLQNLDLSKNHHNILYQMPIANMTSLHTLNLSDRPIPSDIFLQLVNMNHLRNLNLSGCYLNKEVIQIILINMPNLEDLNLMNNLSLDDNFITTLAEMPESSLQSLDISNCPFITGNGARVLASRLKKLTSLKHDNCNFDAQTESDLEKKLQKRRERFLNPITTKKRKRLSD